MEDDNVLLFIMSRRRGVSVKDKLHLDVRSHRATQDYQLLADQLGITSSTARTIVSARSIGQCNNSQSVQQIRDVEYQSSLNVLSVIMKSKTYAPPKHLLPLHNI